MSLMIQYGTLTTPFRARVSFSRRDVHSYTVNHPIAHTPVTFYMTDTKTSTIPNTVFYDLDSLIILEPILLSLNFF